MESVSLNSLKIENAIKDNKERTSLFAISFEYNVNGNAYSFTEGREEIALAIPDTNPVKIKIYERFLLDGLKQAGGKFPIVLIFYRMHEEPYADMKFVDLIYDEEVGILKTKTYRIESIDNEGNCKIIERI